MAVLRQLKTGLLRRMGDPVAGTWGSFRYATELSDVITDELAEALNEGQALAARDCYTPEYYPLLRYDSQIPIVSGREIYTLPVDFISIEEIRYVRGPQNYPMKRRSIKHVRNRFERVQQGGVLQYYDYQGMMAVYVAEGVTEEASQNTIIDSNGVFDTVRMGDIVHNLTDDSEGVVETITNGRITVSELQAGRANTFQRGDTYAIARQEENRWALQVYPRVAATDKIIYTGSSENFSVSASDTIPIGNIWVQFTSLPDDFERDETVLFRLYRGDTLYENPLGPAEIGRQDLRVGWNQLEIPKISLVTSETPTTFEDIDYTFRIQFTEDVEYTLRATREDGTMLPIAQIRLSTRRKDSVLMTYARTPRVMKTDNSVFELPVDFLEPTYKRAKIILHEKLNNAGVAPQLLTEYEQECDKTIHNFSIRDESGPYEFEVDNEGKIRDYNQDSNWTPYFR